MEPEPKFTENLIYAVALLTVAFIPIGNYLRRRALERRRQFEEETQRQTFRYVEAQQGRQDYPYQP